MRAGIYANQHEIFETLFSLQGENKNYISVLMAPNIIQFCSSQ